MAEQRVSPDVKLAVGVMVVLAAIASIVDNGILGWIIAPICILLAWFAIFRAPLKHTMLALMFAALVLENPAESPASGKWDTPFAPIGALLLAHFKVVIGGWMFFGGLDLMLIAATAVLFLRGASATRGGIPTPKPMIRLAQLGYLTILFAWALGKWRGGDGSFAVWQIDRVMYLPAVFLLCQAAFSAPKDYLAVGKVALTAAVLRASQAIYVRATVPYTIDPITGESSLPYATTHNDSMLFAVGSVILVSLVLQRVGKKATRLAVLLTPILIGGMIANNRRMVWVEIILVFITLYLITDPNSFKRKMNRAMIALSPVLLGYLVAGWTSESAIFKPVKVIRSAIDSSSDMSTAWRDLENFNLVFTIRAFPTTGLGLGSGFWEMWPMPVVDYTLERYIPHNSILGLLCYYGYFGFMGLTALWVAGVFFAIRAYHFAKVPLEKAAALAAFAAVLVYYLQCFGDMGLGSMTGVFLVAPSIAIACKLAVANGAWQSAPVRQASRRGGFTAPIPAASAATASHSSSV